MTLTAASHRTSSTLLRLPRAVTIGVIATLISVAGSWIPSFWGDEAATVLSAERPLASLWPMLGTVDAVHGVYYVFMHFWIQAFGSSEFSNRLPSAVAVGIAAAGVVVLARRLFDGRVAVVAGLVFAVLPRVTYMGAEARSYAMGAAIAVWCTILLVRALHDGRTRWWIGYAGAMSVGVYLFLFLALLIAVHAAWIVTTRVSWGTRARWVAWIGASTLAAAPIISADIDQRHQVAFIATRHTVTFSGVAFNQWFGGPAVGIAAWMLIAIGVVALRRPAGMRLIGAWIVLPTTLLIAVNSWVAPAYSLRYLSFCTPAIAIGIAVGVAALGERRRQVVVAAVLAPLIAPTFVAQRSAFAKDGGSDLRQVADFVHSVAAPGDAITFDDSVRPSRKPRLALRLYPTQFAGLRDVEIVTAYDQTTGLWDVVSPIAEHADRLQGVQTVWLVESVGSSDTAAHVSASALLADGFTEGAAHRLNRERVIAFTRG